MKAYTTPEIKVTYFETEVVLTAEGTETPMPFNALSGLNSVTVGEDAKTIQKVAGIQFAE